MAESITTNYSTTFRCSTPHASLAAVGLKLQDLNFFAPIKELVQIQRKTVRHTPIDKLYDAFISILAGAHGLVEINTRLRSDPALQRLRPRRLRRTIRGSRHFGCLRPNQRGADGSRPR